MKKKVSIAICALVLVAGTVLGSLAYFTDRDEIENTFTVGKVAIQLTETNAKDNKIEHHLNPGITVAKDPTVLVENDSEDCYLYFTEEKGGQTDRALAYTLNTNGWESFERAGKTIYFREVDSAAAVRQFNLITDNQVQIKTELTNKTITDTSEVFLTYKAYAIQKSGFTSAKEAFEECFVND